MIELTAQTPLAPVEKRTLIIAMTERSGSTNLCSVLTRLGRFGEPDEFFNPLGEMHRLADEMGAREASDYLAKLATQSEIFCFKTSALDWRPFAKRARAVFPNARYVFLDRQDVDAQAISLYRARRTWLWHDKPEWGQQRPPEDDAFDAEELEACREHLLKGKAKWAQFFFENDIRPLHIVYEHMMADMAKAVQMICCEAGLLVFQQDVPHGEYAILRDERTEAWKQQLRHMRMGRPTNTG